MAGYDVVEEPLEAKRRTGYLPESPPVYPDMTVVEYLAFVARIKGVPRREIKGRLDEIVEKCAVGNVRNRQIGKLSKGYRQRVGLAQALIHNPEVLVLDEPTAGLDPKQIIETRELITGLGGPAHGDPKHAHSAGSLQNLPARGGDQRGGDRGRRDA